MNKHTVKLYTNKEFIDNQTLTTSENRTYFKKDYESFFCGRLEELMHLVTYPISASRATTHCIYFLTDGTICMTKGLTRYTVKKGDCLVVPAYHISSIEWVDPKTKGFFLSLSPNLLSGRFISRNDVGSFKFLLPYSQSYFSGSTTNPFVANLLNRLITEYGRFGFKRSKLVISYVVSFFYELYYQDIANKPDPIDRYQNITYQFKDLLFKHVARFHKTSEYANLIGITPNHLNKVLKRTTGKSPILWINEALVLEAKVLLEETGLSISEIAAKMGIYEPSYFARLFKKITDLTPTQYREGLNSTRDTP
ncbi:helix-turn-helix transcriptional regulator [Muricauda sp. SCSIO 64092]|uniref:AraC family transcriptional regulator n=1 Tax=Allomuricauda sp. SCSIO 64092 TaxID=2908842 RepID=UPI001FF2D606|nr:helix-turn-helix transcriptional regulator [Muricauda sp. SCSIO 64092]UOY06796.1 helix-turn-helix transcriptional regulator [Muricauda sp. SCSIO 64092]